MNVYQNRTGKHRDWPSPAWEIAQIFPAQGSWSEADYLSLKTPYLIEYSKGEVEVLAFATDRHQAIVGVISNQQ